MKNIIFDMDGTIADLYGVKNWLNYLENSDPFPYISAKPLGNFPKIISELNRLKSTKRYKVTIISWLAKDSTKEYDIQVRLMKKVWLDYYNFPYDEIHFIKYGTPKQKYADSSCAINYLFDDNESVRESFESKRKRKTLRLSFSETDIENVLCALN